MTEPNNSNNSDSESDPGGKPSKNNSTPGFGLLGSLPCLYGDGNSGENDRRNNTGQKITMKQPISFSIVLFTFVLLFLVPRFYNSNTG